MEYFFFDIESPSGTPNHGRSYMIDITNERMQKDMNYRHRNQFMRANAVDRLSAKVKVGGEIISELTVKNVAWSYLFGLMLGSRTVISGYKFSESLNKPWGIKIGYLNADITADSTNFEIVADSGSFDTVDAIVVNDEFIETSEITANEVISCVRGSQGTTARVHGISDLVYGVSADVLRSIVLAHRKKVESFVVNDYTITSIVNKSGDLYGFYGLIMKKLTVNFRAFDTIATHMEFMGRSSANELALTDDSTTDDNPIVGMTDIKVCTLNEEVGLHQFFLEINNKVGVGGYQFMNSAPQKLFITGTDCYGTITWNEESAEHVTQYEDNTKRHFSISISNDDYRMITALNDVRINTPSHYHDGDLLIQDSAPWYAYEEPVIMFQF